jgi:hypothetical protein
MDRKVEIEKRNQELYAKMSTIFKKSLKLSLAAIATLKVSDSLYTQDSRLADHYQRFWH